MKVYIFMADWDGTMSSSPEIDTVYLHKKDAEVRLEKQKASKNWYWEGQCYIREAEVVE